MSIFRRFSVKFILVISTRTIYIVIDGGGGVGRGNGWVTGLGDGFLRVNEFKGQGLAGQGTMRYQNPLANQYLAAGDAGKKLRVL